MLILQYMDDTFFFYNDKTQLLLTLKAKLTPNIMSTPMQQEKTAFPFSLLFKYRYK